jgi:hypothetical protein
MILSRRKLFSILAGIPGVATLAAKSKPWIGVDLAEPGSDKTVYRGTSLCMNCRKVHSEDSLAQVAVEDVKHGRGSVSLCKECRAEITNCATCERRLNYVVRWRHLDGSVITINYGTGVLRLSPASEPIAPLAWPKTDWQPLRYGNRGGYFKPQEGQGKDSVIGLYVTAEYFSENYGTRPVARDLIVADCAMCSRFRDPDPGGPVPIGLIGNSCPPVHPRPA